MPDYTDEDQEYPGNPSRDLAAEPPPEEAIARAPITAPGVINRGVVNPGNWVYASSRYADQPPVQFPDQPPSQGPFPYGVNRFDLPNGVTAFHVSEDYRQKQFDLAKEAQAASIAAEHAAQDAQMFQQMSRVATSLKDISEARRQIDIMGLQRDIQNGVPIHEAVARHPMGLGAGYGNALRASALVTPPTFGKTPSGAEYVLDPRGTPHFTPGTGQQPSHALGEVIQVRDPVNGQVIANVIATGPQTGHVQKPEGVNLTPAQQVQVQRARISAINAELANAYSIPDKKIRDKFVADKTAELSDISSRLKDMPNKVEAPKGIGETGRINPLPSKKSELVTGQLYDTKRGVGRWNGNQFEEVKTK